MSTKKTIFVLTIFAIFYFAVMLLDSDSLMISHYTVFGKVCMHDIREVQGGGFLGMRFVVAALPKSLNLSLKTQPPKSFKTF